MAGLTGQGANAFMQSFLEAFNSGQARTERRDEREKDRAFRQMQFDFQREQQDFNNTFRQDQFNYQKQQDQYNQGVADYTRQANALAYSGQLQGDTGIYGRDQRELESKYGFNPFSYASPQAMNYQTPEQKKQEALGMYEDKLKLNNQYARKEPKIILTEMDGPDGWGKYVVFADNPSKNPRFVGATPRPQQPGTMPEFMPIDTTARRNLAEKVEAIKKFSGVQETIEHSDGGTGWWQGYTPNAILSKIDPEGVPLRSAVANFSSQIMNRLSGAAVSEAEKKRLEAFLPTQMDSKETLLKKMGGYRSFMQDEIDAWQDMYGEHPVSIRAEQGLGGKLRYNPETGDFE